jgi:hypothetical protein
MKAVDPDALRALVRRALQEKLMPASPAVRALPSIHASHLDITVGPECSEDLDLPLQKPCLIEPHRLCYNSGYCKKLGH